MTTTFSALLAEVLAAPGADRFGHRQHVQLTWLAVDRLGPAAALELVDAGIREAARAGGAPGKYHATMTRAWLELVAHHAAATRGEDFEDFLRAAPELLDKGLLNRFYSAELLGSPAARASWVAPDLAPLP
ncbi:hypothetical protein [Streptacidiphilus rugosus]|uniref:hypothetical protein n=1 Tax=Streptacidiphilus rugosus TaxID=405783 RepID=UPI00055F6034|nr:hypothetical protein [Streptacidiphilus rugosus]